jgi:hypothetical protein
MEWYKSKYTAITSNFQNTVLVYNKKPKYNVQVMNMKGQSSEMTLSHKALYVVSIVLMLYSSSKEIQTK